MKGMTKKIKSDASFALSCLYTLSKMEEGGLKRVDRQSLLSVLKIYKKSGGISAQHLRLVRRKLRKYVNTLQKVKILNIETKMTSRVLCCSKVLSMHTKKTMLIDFPYDDKLSKFIKKNIYGRSFDRFVKNKWTATPTHDNIQKLKDKGFVLSDDVKEVWRTFYPEPVKLEKTWDVFPYQQEGLEFLVGANGRGLIGDDMGLGKTIQALYWMFYSKVLPILVTMPKSVKLNWKREINKWIPEANVQVISGREHQDITGDIVLINHDIIFDTILVEKRINGVKKKVKDAIPIENLSKIKFKACVVDEIQNFKNKDSLRSKALRKIVKNILYLIGLSGTPIKNKPIEFFNFLNMLDSLKWPSRWEFAKEFCDLKETNFGWDYSGFSNLDKLNKKLRGTMIRRLKSEVLKQLPPKTRTIIPLELAKSEIREYTQYEKNVRELLRSEHKKAQQLRLIGKLKRKAIELKLKHCIEWIEDYLSINPKLVVFAYHRKVIEHLHEHFGPKALKIYGGTSENERDRVVQEFQNNPKIELLIGSIPATKEGLNFTAAKDSVTIEFVWEPTDHQQCEDRVHRIGQESDNVGAYYLIIPNSIEEHIAKLLDSKIKIITKILNGEKAETKELFSELLESYKKQLKSY